jgi:hypothetical protein
MPRNNYGGRKTAKNPAAADIHGRVRERAFDLPAELPPVRLSEHELADEAYKALPEDQRGQLLGFLESQIQPATARTGNGRGGLSGCLWSDSLAGDATAFLGHHVNIRVINGALRAAGYNPVARTSRGAVWPVGARKKES